MKALTLWEPWASAIIHGPKRIENRPWKPWDSVMGQRIAIHAGKRYDADAFGGIAEVWPEVNQDGRSGILGVATVAGWIQEVDDWLFDVHHVAHSHKHFYRHPNINAYWLPDGNAE